MMPLLLPACATMRKCPIETLQPENLTFEGSRNNIVICAPHSLLSDAIMSNVTAADVPADSLIANILFSLQRLWEEASGYEDTQFFIHITPTDELPEISNYDIMVRLDRLQINNTYYGQEYSYFEWEAYLYVNFTAKWSIRNGFGKLLDEYTDRDLMVWSSGMRMGKADAVMNLPKVKDVWWDMGIALAKKYIARVVPQWKTGVREIYMINKYPELSQQAYKAMQNNSYIRAFDIWENMLLSCRNRHKKAKSQITFNMAVACEFQNELDQALYWAKRSLKLKVKTKTVNYLKILNERKQQNLQLDMQLQRN